jgi:antitoxin component YwqK of YwqJK toxin-antitoxin module
MVLLTIYEDNTLKDIMEVKYISKLFHEIIITHYENGLPNKKVVYDYENGLLHTKKVFKKDGKLFHKQIFTFKDGLCVNKVVVDDNEEILAVFQYTYEGKKIISTTVLHEYEDRQGHRVPFKKTVFDENNKILEEEEICYGALDEQQPSE